MEIKGAKVLITGATGGLGAAIARSLYDNGAQLILSGRRVDVLESLAAELNAQAIACDMSDPKQLQTLVDKNSDLDIYIANAGIPGSGRAMDLSAEEVDRVISINLRTPIVSSNAFAKQMAQRRKGSIVFISSLSGLTASPRNSMYSATKFGLRGYSLALRQEMHEYGVGVSVVLPGFIRDAGMFADTGVELPKGTRTKSPQDVARAVVKAIVHNPAEILVAPLELRLGARFGGMIPALAEAAQRTGGARRTMLNMEESQRNIH